MSVNEPKLFKFTVQWEQQIREQIYQDESRLVGTRKVRSEAYVIAPTKELAEIYLKDRLQWSSVKGFLSVENVEELYIYGIVSATMIGSLCNTREG